MELNQMEYFLTVAKSQHVTRAAEALKMTAPALSHSLAKLEEELGVQLFEKRPQRSVEPIRQLIREKGEAALDRFGSESGTGRAGGSEYRACLASLSEYSGQRSDPAIDPGIPAIASRHPVPAGTGKSRYDPECLESGESDLGITCPGSSQIGLSRLPLFSKPMYAVVPAGHRLDGRKRISLEERRESRSSTKV